MAELPHEVGQIERTSLSEKDPDGLHHVKAERRMLLAMTRAQNSLSSKAHSGQSSSKRWLGFVHLKRMRAARRPATAGPT